MNGATKRPKTRDDVMMWWRKSSSFKVTKRIYDNRMAATGSRSIFYDDIVHSIPTVFTGFCVGEFREIN